MNARICMLCRAPLDSQATVPACPACAPVYRIVNEGTFHLPAVLERENDDTVLQRAWDFETSLCLRSPHRITLIERRRRALARTCPAGGRR